MTSHDAAKMITIPRTDLTVYPLCLGGNVFGWSADAEESFAILDAYFEAGGNFIDTADVYSEWIEGNTGGDSEIIIGNWMKSRGNRSKMVIATKVAKFSKRPGLSADNIRSAAKDSLHRLQTDYIDLYYAHEDDETVTLEETNQAFNELVTDGKVRYLGASNFNGTRLKESIEFSAANNLTQYAAIQNHYNLLARNEYETEMAPVLTKLGITCLPFFGLARGFLSGKYKAGVTVDSVRAGGVKDYQNEVGWKVIAQLEEIALVHEASVGAVALAWLRSQETVSVPIASARTVAQLTQIMAVVELSSREIDDLSAITAY
jgi:aryl-alcohol dehydrogenase-like predicted oxidoreductase